jgi:hypothetical protein
MRKQACAGSEKHASILAHLLGNLHRKDYH